MDNIRPRDMVKEMLKRTTGEEPQIDEPTCLLWKADHKNCKGCPSDLACAKMVAIMLITLKGSLYEPKNFEDSLVTQSVMSKITDRILAAKTADEVHTIV